MQRTYFGLFESGETRSDYVFGNLKEAELQKRVYERHGHGPFEIKETSQSGRLIEKRHTEKDVKLAEAVLRRAGVKYVRPSTRIREMIRHREDDRTFEEVYGKAGIGDNSALVPSFVRNLKFHESKARGGHRSLREDSRDVPILPIGRLRSKKIFDYEELKDMVAYVIGTDGDYKVVLSAGNLGSKFDEGTIHSFVHDQTHRPLFHGDVAHIIPAQGAFDKYGAASAFVFK
jgi:hypothetical protein